MLGGELFVGAEGADVELADDEDEDCEEEREEEPELLEEEEALLDEPLEDEELADDAALELELGADVEAALLDADDWALVAELVGELEELPADAAADELEAGGGGFAPAPMMGPKIPPA